ncbi:MAG: HigA family addiction module antitoxin [Pseudomonadota bacterium]
MPNNTSFRPDYAIPPGVTLLETLDAIGMTQAELADRMGRPKKTINEIIAGKAAIIPETALQLERVLGTPASFWNNLERNYQEARARIQEENRLGAEVSWINNFPIKKMVKNGWLPKEESAIKQLRTLLNYFGVAGVKEWESVWDHKHPQAIYRKSSAFQKNPAAVAAWLRKGEIEARKIICSPYQLSTFKSVLLEIRKLTVEPPEIFVPEIVRKCASTGVAVIFTPEVPGTRVYGATRWVTSSKALIQLSLRGKTDDHLWFTFFHEAGHIILHGKKEVFIEALDGKETSTEREAREKKADHFAQDFLIPPKEVTVFKGMEKITFERINSLARQLGIAPGIIVGRLQHDGLVPYSFGNNLKKKFQFNK